MGEIIDDNGVKREVVKVKSDNPDHDGYYTTYRDAMGLDDVEFAEGEEAVEKPSKKK